MTPIQFKNAIIRNAGKNVDVEFIKKDGSRRQLSGTVRYVDGHDDTNSTAHIPKYVTLVCDVDGKQTWRNVNTETIQSLAIDGKTLYKR